MLPPPLLDSRYVAPSGNHIATKANGGQVSHFLTPVKIGEGVGEMSVNFSCKAPDPVTDRVLTWRRWTASDIRGRLIWTEVKQNCRRAA